MKTNLKLKDIYMRDPFIYVEDNICYLIGTTDKQAWKGKASGFLGYKSVDLVNFEGPYKLFSNSNSFWGDENFWAPELHKIDGKYYIFASFFIEGHVRASQVLVCDTPFGKYSPSKSPFTPKEWYCLDATFYEEKGHKYAIFCHEWLQVRDGEICCGEFNEDFTKLKNIKVLFHGSDAKWACINDIGDGHKNYITDGPFIYKTKDGTLLMLWSSKSKKGYALGVAYSKNGIMGDWLQNDDPLFDKDGGHGMIFEFKGKKYLILHTSNSEHLKERPYIQEIIERDNNLFLKNNLDQMIDIK